MSSMLVYVEALTRFMSSELFKWLVGVGLVVLVLRWCNTPSEKSYTPTYGKLTRDLLDTAIVRTARRNPDLSEVEIAMWANENTLRQIDSTIEAKKKWFVIRIDSHGKILLDE